MTVNSDSRSDPLGRLVGTWTTEATHPGVDPTVVSPRAISITATPIVYSCRDQTDHTGLRVPRSAGSARRSREA